MNETLAVTTSAVVFLGVAFDNSKIVKFASRILPMAAALTASIFASHAWGSGLPRGRIVSTHVSAKSLGSPSDGRLIGGVHLAERPYLRVVPAYAAGDLRWGLDLLTDLIDRGARDVRREFPDAVLSVGHLSRYGGGEVDRHASHESGRDADIGFYIRNSGNKPVYSDHFVAFRGNGTAPSWPGAYFDDARNWAFVASIVADEHVRVSHIFVAAPLRARLIAYARRNAPMSILRRAEELMIQPSDSLPHDDHFHVRISCPDNMKGCIEYSSARIMGDDRRRHSKNSIQNN